MVVGRGSMLRLAREGGALRFFHPYPAMQGGIRIR